MTYKPLAVALLAVSAFGLTACSNSKQAPGPADDIKAETAPTAPAGESTLDKIKKSGEIVLAHRDSSIPFSYIADKPNQPVGYAHDLQ